jgi:hypothetical protein
MRRGLGTTGWSSPGNDGPAFTWPIWESAAPPDTVRSLVQLAELAEIKLDVRPLRARGIAAVYRARRIKVGAGANFKLNFSPARAL